MEDTVSLRSGSTESFELLRHEDAELSPKDEGDIAECLNSRESSPQNPAVGLEDRYQGILGRAAQETGASPDVQAFLLGSITHSCRPLQLSELVGVYLLYSKSNIPAPAAQDLVKKACGSLLQVHDDDTVRVLNPSVTEFLLDVSRLDRMSTFPVIVPWKQQKLLAMLSMDVLKSEWEHAEEKFDYHEHSHPFRRYASVFFVQHLSQLSGLQDEELFEAITSFCEHKNEAGLELYRWWLWYGEPYKQVPYVCTHLSPFFLAGSVGMLAYTRHLVDRGHQLSISAEKFATPKKRKPLEGQHSHQSPCLPIWWACFSGHVEVVEYMLPRTNLWIPRVGEASPTTEVDLFTVSAKYGRSEVVELLLKAGFDPIEYRTLSGKPDLQAFSYWCPLPTVISRLPYLDKATLARLFCRYAMVGRESALRAILDHTDIEVDSQPDGPTALYLACNARRRDETSEQKDHHQVRDRKPVECVRLLLERGASASSRSTVSRSFGGKKTVADRTPLHGLCSGWDDSNHNTSTAIFDLLLNAGADMEAEDSHGDTPLFCLFPHEGWPPDIEKPLAFLLNFGAAISGRDKNGLSILHRALDSHRHPRVVKLLVENGADVNAVVSRESGDERYRNVSPLELLFQHPLRQSCHDGVWGVRAADFPVQNRAITEILVRQGAHIDISGSDDAWIKALPICGVETLRLLLSSRKDEHPLGLILHSLQPTRKPGQHGYWFHSRRRTSPDSQKLREVISVVVQAGASLEERNVQGLTPLLASIHDENLFKAFLEAGADRYAVDGNGDGLLHSFLSQQLRLCYPAPPVTRLQHLVALGFDPCQVNRHGDTILHLAICLEPPGSMQNSPGSGFDSFLSQVLDYGVSPRSTNARGLTPLHLFIEQLSTHWSRPSRSREGDPTCPNHVDKVLCFLESAPGGVDVNAVDDDGLTPLHLCAMSMCHFSARNLEVLVAHGADPTATTKTGANALHLACTARNPAALKSLIYLAPSLLAQRDSLGRTPLFAACASGLVESVGILLDSGAAVNVEDDGGKTPLHACAEFVFEQQKWDVLRQGSDQQRTHGQVPRDRFRPLTCHGDHIARGGQKIHEWRGNLDYLSFSKDDAYLSAFLENPNASIRAVVEKLLHHGANNQSTASFNLTPAEYACNCQCIGMMAALSAVETGTPWTAEMQVQLQLNRPPSVSTWSSLEMRAELIEHPGHYLSILAEDDVEWLLMQEADIVRRISVAESDPNDHESSTKPIKIPVQSFIDTVALLGLTGFMRRIGPLARYYDSPSSRIDQWTLSELKRLRVRKSRIAKPWWTLQDMARCHDFRFLPLLYRACKRPAPNMEMLKVLVEDCGVDVNARDIRDRTPLARPALTCPQTALGYLAATREYWHLDAIRYLVHHGADVNIRDANGETPLFIVCDPSRQGHLRDKSPLWTIRFAELLLQLGADTSIPNEKGQTCLEVAGSHCPELVDFITSYNGDKSSWMHSLVYNAVKRFDIGLMRRAIDAGADLNSPDDKYVWTRTFRHDQPDHHFPIVGAFFHRQNDQAKTKVELLAKRFAFIRFMLGHGADPFLVLPSGDMFLHAAFEGKVLDDDLVSFLLDPSLGIKFDTRDAAGRSILQLVCVESERVHSYGDPDAVKICTMLLDSGVEATAVDGKGMTFLHHIVANQDFPTQAILSFLVRPEIASLAAVSDASGCQPLFYTMNPLRPDLCIALLDAGASASNIPLGSGGKTALHLIATQIFRVERQAKELPLSLDLPILDSVSTTCVQEGHGADALTLWKRLIAGGMDVNARDEEGNTPLFAFLATKHAHLDRRWEARHEMALKLRGALNDFFGDVDLHARNDRGETALHVLAAGCERAGVTELFELLSTAKGLDPHVRDAEGRSALDVAGQAPLKQGVLDLFKQDGSEEEDFEPWAGLCEV